MPTYDYRCAKCGEDLEVFQSFAEAPLTKHRGCGGKLVKVLSPAGIVLKGSGFYKTDNRDSGKRSGTKESSSKESGSGSDSSSKANGATGSDGSSSESKKADTSSGAGSGSGSDAKKPAAKSA